MPDSAAEAAPAAPPLLEIRDATVMRGERLALDRFSLTVADGQHVAILGRNGSGKSTLVRLIARKLHPLHGAQVRIFGAERWRIQDLRGLLGIVSPALQDDYAGGKGRLDAFSAVAGSFFGARALWDPHALTQDMRRRSEEALDAMGVGPLAGADVASLSTGETRRVLIARALVHAPRALLLDEPCAGLDPATRRQFLETLRGLARAGTTLVLVTHHLEEIVPEIESVALLRDGRLFAAGAKRELLTSAMLGDVFGAPMEVGERGGWYRADVAP